MSTWRPGTHGNMKIWDTRTRGTIVSCAFPHSPRASAHVPMPIFTRTYLLAPFCYVSLCRVLYRVPLPCAPYQCPFPISPLPSPSHVPSSYAFVMCLRCVPCKFSPVSAHLPVPICQCPCVSAHLLVPIYQRPFASATCQCLCAMCPFAIAHVPLLICRVHSPWPMCQCPFNLTICHCSCSDDHFYEAIYRCPLAMRPVPCAMWICHVPIHHCHCVSVHLPCPLPVPHVPCACVMIRSHQSFPHGPYVSAHFVHRPLASAHIASAHFASARLPARICQHQFASALFVLLMYHLLIYLRCWRREPPQWHIGKGTKQMGAGTRPQVKWLLEHGKGKWAHGHMERGTV